MALLFQTLLQQNSFKVGNYLKLKLNTLKNKFPDKIIEIRGEGLFLGIDLIDKGNPLLPNKRLAKYIINYCRKLGVLISTDGPNDNILKIKPPIIFNLKDANFLIKTINDSLLKYEKK